MRPFTNVTPRSRRAPWPCACEGRTATGQVATRVFHAAALRKTRADRTAHEMAVAVGEREVLAWTLGLRQARANCDRRSGASRSRSMQSRTYEQRSGELDVSAQPARSTLSVPRQDALGGRSGGNAMWSGRPGPCSVSSASALGTGGGCISRKNAQASTRSESLGAVGTGGIESREHERPVHGNGRLDGTLGRLPPHGSCDGIKCRRSYTIDNAVAGCGPCAAAL
jgi:hypothetical protein